jgi:hypothetical protein
VKFFLKSIKVKKIVFLLILISSFGTISAQRLNLEPGVFIGTSYYLGDVNHARQFYSPGLSLGLIARYPINEHYAVRLNLLRAKISGNDADFSNLYQQTRGYSFENTIYEIGLLTEFNFLSYSSFIKKSYTPFITIGLAVAISQATALSIPIGIGWKYSLGKKMTLSAEWVFRNTTTDELDLLLPAESTSKQITNLNNVDWYSIAGITMTYNISSDKKWCPAYKHPK